MKALLGTAGVMTSAAVALSMAFSGVAHADTDPIQTFQHGVSGLCLDSPANPGDNNIPVRVLANPLGPWCGANNRWEQFYVHKVDEYAEGVQGVNLIAVQSGLCLDSPANPGDNNVPVRLLACNGTHWQVWFPITSPLNKSAVIFYHDGDGLCLDSAANAGDNNIPVRTFTCWFDPAHSENDQYLPYQEWF